CCAFAPARARRRPRHSWLVGAANGPATLAGRSDVSKPAPAGSAEAALFPNDAAGRCSRGVNTSTSAAVICTNSINFPFVQPLLGNSGNFARNALPLDNFQVWDWALSKNTKLTERLGLLFRWEVTNVFNHANFSGFQNALTSSLFGEYTSTASDSRKMQASLKVIF